MPLRIPARALTVVLMLSQRLRRVKMCLDSYHHKIQILLINRFILALMF